MKQIVNSNKHKDWPGISIDFHRPIELYVDSPLGDERNNSYKILWLREVAAVSNFRKYVLKNYKLFDAILTYDDIVLKNCNNSHYMAFGTTWAQDYDTQKEKLFQVSHLTGFKSKTQGHLLRHEINNLQELIKTPKDFYVSHIRDVPNKHANKILHESKAPLFDSQFHICIENSKQNWYFSEKLIDCFITKTIPIYWGCDDIGKFFNTDGFFIANNASEIIKICNDLKHDTYQSKIKYINENYEKCIYYSETNDRLKETIEKILNNG